MQTALDRFGRVDAVAGPTADDIAAHIAEVAATEPFTIPGSIYDEVFEVGERLGVTG